jgi:hypothetical protein
MSMSKLAAGIGAAALVAAMSLPVSAIAAPKHQSVAGKGAVTDVSAARWHHRYYRHWGYRPYRYGWHRRYWGPPYGYYRPYYGYYGPRAYVSLPFFGFSIW